MKRLVLMVSLLFVLIVPQASWAATSKYPDPYRQTMWNNLTDGMHTLGQSTQQAKWTKMRLHNTRARTRIRNINHAKQQAWLNSQ